MDLMEIVNISDASVSRIVDALRSSGEAIPEDRKRVHAINWLLGFYLEGPLWREKAADEMERLRITLP